ncbi:RNA-directed DNA polymerase, eukaryota [Tanacetum coccineum]
MISRPISLIGSVYKVVTKVLANRLAPVIADLISDTQSAFVAGRQILDGPFILDEILHWCKRKNKKAMFFKVDFAKAYDSVRWDYLLEVLEAFGFGRTWCNWIRGTLTSAKASILINGSPSKEYSCHPWSLTRDPHVLIYFILIMYLFNISFNRVVDEGLFKEASFLLLDLTNILKSQLLGVCVPHQVVEQAASLIGCSIMSNKFRYLGVMVGEYSSRIKAWDDVYFLSLDSRSLSGRFWFDCWIGDVPLRVKFPRLFALDLNKEASVAVKLSAPIDISFRRNARGGIEEHLLADLTSLMDSVTLSNSGDRWVCDLVSDGNFRVKEIRNYIDDLFLPHQAAQTRWIKYIPIKVNIFAWRARQDCLPTRVNLIRRGITIESLFVGCSVCEEDVCHISSVCDFGFACSFVGICRWWGLDPHDGHRSKSGSLGFFRFSSPLRSKLCWRECSSYLGGLSGTLGIGSFLKNLLQDVRKFLML